MGSDWSVSSPDPLEEIHVAVNRQMPADYPHKVENREVFLPEERLDLATALAGFTMGSAYVNHLDSTDRVDRGRQVRRPRGDRPEPVRTPGRGDRLGHRAADVRRRGARLRGFPRLGGERGRDHMHRRNTMVARLVAVSALTLTLLVPSLSAGAVQERGGLYQCRMAATPFAGPRSRCGSGSPPASRTTRGGSASGTTGRGSSRRSAGRTRPATSRSVKVIENLHGRDELLSRARDISSGSVCDVAFKV